MTKLPKALAEETFTLLGVSVTCCVLDNGQRIVKGPDFEALLRRMSELDPSVPLSEAELAEFERCQRWAKGVSN